MCNVCSSRKCSARHDLCCQDAKIGTCYAFCRVKLDSMRQYRDVLSDATGAPPPGSQVYEQTTRHHLLC